MMAVMIDRPVARHLNHSNHMSQCEPFQRTAGAAGRSDAGCAHLTLIDPRSNLGRYSAFLGLVRESFRPAAASQW
jgi:hypothetical protein